MTFPSKGEDGQPKDTQIVNLADADESTELSFASKEDYQ